VAALVILVVSSSGGGTMQSPPGSLVLGEVAIAPAVDPGGMVFSLVLRNVSAQPIRVTSVVPVADDGLHVDVLGITGCRAGCPGAMGWRDAQPLIARLVPSPQGVVVPPEAAVRSGRADGLWIVLHVSPRDAEAEASLQQRCLFVEELRVTIGGRRSDALRNQLHDFVVAIDRADAGQPGTARNCTLF
jgi:hypothetical protein